MYIIYIYIYVYNVYIYMYIYNIYICIYIYNIYVYIYIHMSYILGASLGPARAPELGRWPGLSPPTTEAEALGFKALKGLLYRGDRVPIEGILGLL